MMSGFDSMELLRVLLSLGAVLALVWLVAVGLRRAGLSQASGTGPLNVQQTILVGSRERLVVLGTPEGHLVVAVSPQGVSRIAQFPAGAAGGIDPATAARSGGRGSEVEGCA